ncbi:hypothetical protein V525_03050 [Gordonia alkanivorans CGMCC 6845]|uniref:Uncharacterized protein n=1 Tax=Gordonia alkanivorans CGMCC 6845 TaxID=1423140 RepID=W9DIK9_9ACTN|nr:hypothetical protein V525_03050 [Gordonia alkanivorans CGMCC 6845]
MHPLWFHTDTLRLPDLRPIAERTEVGCSTESSVSVIDGKL